MATILISPIEPRSVEDILVDINCSILEQVAARVLLEFREQAHRHILPELMVQMCHTMMLGDEGGWRASRREARLFTAHFFKQKMDI